MKKDKRTLPLVIAAVAVLIAILIGYIIMQRSKPTITQRGGLISVGESSEWQNTITYNGKTYVWNTSLETILFLGVDDTEAVDAGGTIGNNGRADALILFILNQDTEEVQMLQISRDTITDVDVYDINGDLVMSGDMQINMQYAFGDSDRRSSWLTAQKVSDLLLGLPIDAYITVKMEGISDIVDQLDGVTVTMPEDYTDIDASYVKGATVTLDGEQAETFVRSRDTEVSGSNEDRLERQNVFLQAMFQQMHNAGDFSLVNLYNNSSEYITTDMDVDEMDRFSSYMLLEDELELPGSSEEGELHDEYYVDEDAMRELLVELFYEPMS